jgi:riboflavin transporter FmnP
MLRAWKRDTVTIGAIAGFVATVAFVLSDWVLVRLAGLKYGAAWEYAAEMFLNIGLVHIPVGRLIGYIGEFGMGTGFGVSVAFVLRRTGKDNYLLKGLAAAGVWYTILLAVVPRWLHVAAWVFGQPFTILMALKNWILMGVIIPFIVARYAEFAPAETKLAQIVDAPSPPEQLDGKTKRLEAELVHDGSNRPEHGDGRRRPRILRLRKKR